MKELPFKMPFISYEPLTNHIIGIIASDFERFQSALYNNFIDIVTTSTANYYGLKDFLNYHMFDVNRIPRDIIHGLDKHKIIDLIKKWIDEEQYIVVNFNTFYVSNYSTYKKRYFNHYAMIYGYDTQEEVFLCADFFDFDYYSVQKCSMNEVIDAIIHNENPRKRGYGSDFLLLRIEEIAAPKLYVNKIITSLQTLLAENNLRYNRIYGLNIFDNICSIIENGDLEDIRHEFKRKVHFLVAHMEIMILRVQYFYKISGNEKFNEVLADINVLKKQMEQCRNYVLKIVLTDQWIFPVQTRGIYVEKLKEVRKNYTSSIQVLINLLLDIDLDKFIA